ncbi:hypothetical protein CAOG_01183 [Capsaspora owczarzaki ATCC 30864]|uniref:Enoyl reductase (ER) domain-containing protein n=1 Tax=Capsaspora owczarzaki (strain ATCC 30864) TaxID=595528 RepID=A0A0D2X0W2_CAPO3|nr:hypothetical protein CAOG_01183 [Capsaspora owczarzaki ATCC 30864]KJE89754.1 hypothetical protein CAOG_001183 [Capsaspora owczarzaki ATCC 30864]|eukprot:XP_004366054.1 hypothetical protein CAOG_01183 [Capsaspora owczarzaki ATCC 30864]
MRALTVALGAASSSQSDALAEPPPLQLAVADSRPLPTPLPHEVLLEVRASAVHLRDLRLCAASAAGSAAAGSASRSISSSSAAGPSPAQPSQQPVAAVPGCEVSGIVVRLGAAVVGSQLRVGDEVVGLLAPGSGSGSGSGSGGALAEYALVSVANIVRKPAGIPHHVAAAALKPGVMAFTALHYKARIAPGESVLVLGVTNPQTAALATAQLAQAWGARVLVAAANDAEAQWISTSLPKAIVIRTAIGTAGGSSATAGRTYPFSAGAASLLGTPRVSPLVSAVMQETSGFGVDVIIDSGLVRQYNKVDPTQVLYSKHELISCLAVHGRWVTSVSHLQLDPPESQLLLQKSASLCFLFEHAWVLSGTHQGRLLHILKEVMDKLESKTIVPRISRTFQSLEQVQEWITEQLAAPAPAPLSATTPVSAEAWGQAVYDVASA